MHPARYPKTSAIPSIVVVFFLMSEHKFRPFAALPT